VEAPVIDRDPALTELVASARALRDAERMRRRTAHSVAWIEAQERFDYELSRLQRALDALDASTSSGFHHRKHTEVPRE
jgi:hypothetical protein